MRSQHYADDTVIGTRRLLPKLWQRLSPILLKNRGRVGLALLCLLGAKVALMYIPFLLKALVDLKYGSPIFDNISLGYPSPSSSIATIVKSLLLFKLIKTLLLQNLFALPIKFLKP